MQGRDDRITELLTKGVEQILPSREYVQKRLEKGEVLTVYCGFDPTAPTLHIGHTIQLRKLKQFQELGHKVIFLIGDFTARIGDPTDKAAARKQLSENEIKKNLRLYKKQASKFLRFSGKNAAAVKFNNRWLGSMKFADVLSLAAHMTVDQMLKRDMFARRVEEEKPIHLHEFLYPLMQGYDSVAMNVDGEVGGNDQLFNMLAGRTLLQQIKGREKFVIANKLLTDNSGKKMGKSEGNMVALSDSPRDIYGKVMSWSDGLILPGFELCTDTTLPGLEDIAQAMRQGTNPRDLKMKLAREITAEIYDEKTAQEAESFFVTTFQKGEIAKDITTYPHEHTTLEAFLIEKGIVSSKSELRRLTEAGAVENVTKGIRLSVKEVKDFVTAHTVYRVGKTTYFNITD